MSDPALPSGEHNLIWIDLEMTGLSPLTDRIIEIAVVVTDAQITRRVAGPVLAVHQPDAVLDAMDAWNKGTHGRSGLIERVKASAIDEAAAQAQVIDFLERYVPAGKSPMCGNSIWHRALSQAEKLLVPAGRVTRKRHSAPSSARKSEPRMWRMSLGAMNCR